MYVRTLALYETYMKRTERDAHKLLVWGTLSLGSKHPHLAVRYTYHLVEFCLFSGRDDKQSDIVFGFGRLFSVFTTMFFPVGWSLAFTVLFTVSFFL